MKLLLLIWNFVMFIHILGCLWYTIVKRHEQWNINLFFINVYTTENKIVFKPDTWYQYLLVLYTGFFPFGMGEICPRT